MAKILLSNRSYLLGYNLGKAATEQLQQIGKQKNFKFLNESDQDELRSTLAQTRHCLGIFLCAEGLAEGELCRLEADLEQQAPHCKRIRIESGDNLTGRVDELLQQLQPERLDELTEFSANYILPYLFQGLPEGMLCRTEDAIEKFDSLVTCECLGDDVIGHATFKLNSTALKTCFPTYKQMTDDLILDRLKEFSNQFLGLIIYNLSKVGILTHISLPVSFDVSKAAKLSSGVLYPSAKVADPQGIFQIEFGVINTLGQPLLSLGEITFAPPSETVELF